MAMERPIDLGDRVRVEDAVLLLQRVAIRELFLDPGGVDGPVDDDMTDMNALRAKLAGHGLGQGAQPVLSGREGGITGAAAQVELYNL